MKVLELFAGSRSIGKAAESLGMTVFSSDLKPFPGIDYPVNILNFDPASVPFKPDVIWASPPCTCFSVASLGHHWTGGKRGYIPKTPDAVLSIEIVKKTLELINYYQPKFYFIENPRGMLRTLEVMKAIPVRQTVTYCAYGDTRMKPTDIWTNSLLWQPRPTCKNGDPCHIAAPRGSRTGTQGLSGAYTRSIIPADLCLEIMKSCTL